MGHIKIDNIDITILRRLQKNARTKYSDIAKECHVSVDTIIKRYRKLKQRGIIKYTTLLLDPRKFRNEVLANFSIDVKPQNIENVRVSKKTGTNIIQHSHYGRLRYILNCH
jgi:DNA-binding Lrp family transcriptional regulator